MSQQIKYAIAGFCMGLAELIPGVSGSTIAVVFKIYKNLMSILSELKWSNVSLNISQLSQNFQLKLFFPINRVDAVFHYFILKSHRLFNDISYEEVFFYVTGMAYDYSIDSGCQFLYLSISKTFIACFCISRNRNRIFL